MEAAVGFGVELRGSSFLGKGGSRPPAPRGFAPAIVGEEEPLTQLSVELVVAPTPLPRRTLVATPNPGTLPMTSTSPHPPLTIGLHGRYMDHPGARLEAESPNSTSDDEPGDDAEPLQHRHRDDIYFVPYNPMRSVRSGLKRDDGGVHGDRRKRNR